MPCMSATFDPATGPILRVLIAQSGAFQSLPSAQLSMPAPEAPQQLAASLVPLLIDTGADLTCISPQVAQQLSLTPIGLVPVIVPTGEGLLPKYLVDIGIPFVSITAPGSILAPSQVVYVTDIEVIEFRGSQNYQGLLGRNMLVNAHFSLSIWSKSFTICI
jgi:Aspartyl protease